MIKRLLICVLAFVLLIAITATACIDGNSGLGDATHSAANSTPVPQFQSTRAADATATFAADEFNQQLTAIAGENTP